MAKSRPRCIVGNGGSAGSLNAYKALLDGLPPEKMGAALKRLSGRRAASPLEREGFLNFPNGEI